MRILEKWEESSKYEYYLDGIRDFLKDKNHNLTDLNYIIYGHSHKWKSSQENIGNNEINIINDGAWQNVTPSYVEISSKGRIKIIEIPAFIV
jgi:UDP-2,3-diacylglucosamine pyrophosphatase LpxH